MRLLVLLLGLVLASPLAAGERSVAPGAGSLATAIAEAAPGDVLTLTDGTYLGPVVIDRSLAIVGPRGAVVDGQGSGSVIEITAPDVRLAGFTVTGSGWVNQDLDAGVPPTNTEAGFGNPKPFPSGIDRVLAIQCGEFENDLHPNDACWWLENDFSQVTP